MAAQPSTSAPATVPLTNVTTQLGPIGASTTAPYLTAASTTTAPDLPAANTTTQAELFGAPAEAASLPGSSTTFKRSKNHFLHLTLCFRTIRR